MRSHFALTYLFQAHGERMIGRYPRYRRLWEQVRAAGPDPANAAITFSERDYRDLQVLSQIAWFDEYYLEDPAVKELIEKGQGYSEEDQRFVMSKQHEILKGVLPAYRAAAARGSVELSATPYYHPILPLLCDTNAGRESSPGLPLPSERFRRPDDAEEQIRRALDAHQRTFGVRPVGMWPSEGSVSDEAVGIAAQLGVQWMATDEGVLGRSLGHEMSRDSEGFLDRGSAEKLYNIYRWERDGQTMNMVFRDHRISDLLGFVYAGMRAADAAEHLLNNIKRAAAPVTESGRDAVLSIILDGENAWESYEGNGRDFLRRFYDSLQGDPQIEPVTISEAIARQKPESFGKLRGLVPGSWINANFNVWIGAPEDNKAWDYLSQARDFYDDNASHAREDQRKLAYEELLIAEGSDWNWWYGPEHHSANDRDFDELYRKHLSNVYTALGGVPPDHLARPISSVLTRSTFVPQTAYVRPHDRRTGEQLLRLDGRGDVLQRSPRRQHARQAVCAGGSTPASTKTICMRVWILPPTCRRARRWPRCIWRCAIGEQEVSNFRWRWKCAQGQISGWKLRDEAEESHGLPEQTRRGRSCAGQGVGGEAADGAFGRRRGPHLQPSLRPLPRPLADRCAAAGRLAGDSGCAGRSVDRDRLRVSVAAAFRPFRIASPVRTRQ